LGNNVELSTFQVNGVDVADGDAVPLEYGTTEVTVDVATVDQDATYAIQGDTDLVSGENTLTVTVVAADGEATATYTVTLTVALNNDTTLAVFTVNGAPAKDGDSLDLVTGTTSVAVVVETNDPTATFTIEGDTDLVSGENTLTVTVVAADGEATATYTVTLNVASNSDTSLSTFQVNGENVQDGSVIELPAYTTDVEVAVETTDPDASYVVTGGAELVFGANTLTVLVTAADGKTKEYNVTLNVALGTSVELATFTVNDNDVIGVDTLDLDPYTTDVTVVVETVDPNATFTIAGDGGLHPGAVNTLTVVVTSQDGKTVVPYSVTLNVLLSADNTLKTFKINGADFNDGDALELAANTTSVDVVAETTDPNATLEISGDGKSTTLVVGDQNLVVTVTAPNGDIATYTVVLTVLEESKNANLDGDAGITINGESVDLGLLDTTGYFNVPLGTTSATVVAQTEDETASLTVDTKSITRGGSVSVSLVNGVNLVNFKVTPQAGPAFAQTYVLKVYVGGADATLKTAKVGSTTLVFNGTDATLPSSLPAGTTSVTLYVEPTVALASGLTPGTNVAVAADGSVTKTDTAFTWTVSGLIAGDNVITVTVTPGDSNADSVDYSITVPVDDFSADNSVKVFKINGADVQDGDSIDLPYGTTKVTVLATPTDAAATFSVTGDGKVTPLKAGTSDLVLTIRAANGDEATYTVTLNISDGLNTNIDADAGVYIGAENIDIETLNTAEYFTLPYGTTTIQAKAQTEDAAASMKINDKAVPRGTAVAVTVVNGVNLVTFKVTSPSGAVKSYVLKVYVGGNDTSLKTTKVGNIVVGWGAGTEAQLSSTLPAGTKSITLYVEPKVALAAGVTPGTAVTVAGDGMTAVKTAVAFTWTVSGLIAGENLVTITVVPGDPNGETVDYNLTILVAPSNVTTLTGFTINNVVYAVGSTMALPLKVTSATVVATPTVSTAEVEVSDTSALKPGLNSVSATVTAEDGITVKTYKINILVPKKIDKILIPFAKADLILVDAKKNKAGNTAIVKEIAALNKAKAKVGLVEIANDWAVAKEKKKTSPAARAAAIQKLLKASKTPATLKTTFYVLKAFKLPKAKGVTVYIYTY
jgi:hypothetical protein